MKKYFDSFIHYFAYITTGALIVAAIFWKFVQREMSVGILWEIILSGVLTAIPSALILNFEPETKKGIVICWISHVISIYSISIALLFIFKWIKLSVSSILLSVLAVSLIYLFTAELHFYSDKRHTALLNDALHKRYSDDDKK